MTTGSTVAARWFEARRGMAIGISAGGMSAGQLGMIPLASNVFWGPMAITMMGGLLIATALTLLVVPALYALWFRVKKDEPNAAAAALMDQSELEVIPFRVAAE